jgi:AhpD family alkylhydroperoxidase
MPLDARTASLIAVGASIPANCQPCLDASVTRALKCGADAQDIACAIEVGRTVRVGAASGMDAYTASRDLPALDQQAPGGRTCRCCS